jgi:hypothetical protein
MNGRGNTTPGNAVTRAHAPPLPGAPATDATARPVRLLPTLLVGTVAMAVVVLIVSWAELVTGKIMIGFLQLPPVALPLLFLLIVLNRGVRRWAPRAALAPAELAVIFVMDHGDGEPRRASDGVVCLAAHGHCPSVEAGLCWPTVEPFDTTTIGREALLHRGRRSPRR